MEIFSKNTIRHLREYILVYLDQSMIKLTAEEQAEWATTGYCPGEPGDGPIQAIAALILQAKHTQYEEGFKLGYERGKNDAR